MPIPEGWSQTTLQDFNHPEHGRLYRDPESGFWVQDNGENRRTLKVEFLKLAFPLAEEPFAIKKPKRFRMAKEGKPENSKEVKPKAKITRRRSKKKK